MLWHIKSATASLQCELELDTIGRDKYRSGRKKGESTSSAHLADLRRVRAGALELRKLGGNWELLIRKRGI